MSVKTFMTIYLIVDEIFKYKSGLTDQQTALTTATLLSMIRMTHCYCPGTSSLIKNCLQHILFLEREVILKVEMWSLGRWLKSQINKINENYMTKYHRRWDNVPFEIGMKQPLNQTQMVDWVWCSSPEKLEIINLRPVVVQNTLTWVKSDSTFVKTEMNALCAPRHPQTLEHLVPMQTHTHNILMWFMVPQSQISLSEV